MIPCSKKYKDAIQADLYAMFLSSMSNRTLALMSRRLIGRKISRMKFINASRDLISAVESWRQCYLSSELIKDLYVEGTLF